MVLQNYTHVLVGYFQANIIELYFNKLIQMRDEQMKAGTYDSGLPEGYESWAFENLKELVKIPIYKKRIENIYLN